MQNEFDVLQTETEQLRNKSAGLDDKLAGAMNTAAQRDEQTRRFAAWKKRLREQLLAGDYQWPEDSPFVRIPKKILPQLDVRHPIMHPGVIKQESRELLGLTPTERETAEAALQKYFSAMDSLMEAGRYETNRAKQTHIPATTLASRVFGLPALGTDAQGHVEELQNALKQDLGAERWSLVERQLQSSGTDTLRRILNLDAGERGQEMAVWIKDQKGVLMAGYGWGDQSSAFSSDGLALSLFLPDAKFPTGVNSVEDYTDFRQVPTSLSAPALAWIRQQAETRLNQKGNR